ncbi:gliding motility-associated C-terminal domain-containing protein [Patiriisocius sp. Uisw_017]
MAVGTGSDNITVVTDLSDDNSVLENDATVTYICPIAIVKVGTLNVLVGDCAVVGDTIDYTFTVTNEGNEILSAINVTDPLVPIITFLSGDANGDTFLDLTETWIYTGSYALVAADVLAGQVTNQATVLGTLPSAIVVTDLSDDNSVLENDATVTRLCPIAIIKEGTLNVLVGDCAVVGDTIDYTFTVTNEGNEILSAINVTDPLVPIITFLSGDTNGDTLLDLTETWIYTGSYALVAADVLAGQVTNQATVLGTLPSAIVVTDLSDDNSVLENDATVTRLCPIAIIKEGTLNVLNGNCAVVGDTIDYTFTVTNEGNEILSAINVTDPLVPIITFLSGDTNGDTLLDLTETWIYTGSYALVAADVLAGQVTNQATVLGTLPSAIVVTDLSDDNSVLENDATVTRLCPIAIIKEGTLNVLNGDCAVVGDTIDYTFTVTNEGNEILSAINVTDPLVPIITFLSGDTNGDTLLDLTETWIYTGSYALVAADVLAGQVTNQATVLGTLPSAIVVTDLSDDNSVLENDATVTRLCPIAIIKEGTLNVLNGNCAVVGDTIDYTFTVTNEGNEILSAINVTDPLVPIITFLSGDTNGDTLLDLTETWIYTGSYALVAADVLAGQVTNQATVLGTLPSAIVVTDLSDDNSVLENDATVTRLCPIAIIKEGTLNVLNGNCAVVGDTIDYTFTVTNEGNEILSAINVTDPLVPIITFLSGDTNGDTLLDLTETWIYTGSYALVAADVLAGQVTNQATVLGTLPSAIVVTDLSDDNSVLENDATVTRLCPIAIIKEGTLNVLNGNCAVVGDTIDYTFTVTNEGNEILSAINVTDPLVPIITFLSGDTNGDTLLDLTETWIYTGSYALVAADVLAGQVTNQATVLGTLPSAIVVTDLSDDNSVLENDATVTRLCPIAIIKEGTLNVLNGDCAVVGDTIDYTFTVTNEGNEILSAINVTDPLVPIITFLSGDANGDTLLDLTETWIYTGSYALVAADVLAGQVTNQATVLGTLPSAIVVTDLSDDNSVLENDATVTRLCPIAIIKEGTLNVLNGNCAVVGDTIDYTFTVTNEGNEILSAINVTDPLVPIITFLSGDTNGDTFLDLTETWIYTGSYALVAADVLAGQVTNQATVLGTLPSAIVVTDLSDDNSVLENDATVTRLCPIAIIKEGTLNVLNGNCAVVGDTIDYTFTVTNEGNEILSAINVTDPLVPIITFLSGDTNGDTFLDLTETWIYTGSYALVAADVLAGQVTNQATVLGTLPSAIVVTDLSDDNSVLENDATVTRLCPIAIIKEGTLNVLNGNCAVVGDTIDYTFTVTNEGNEILSAINVTDPLVPIITFLSGDTNGDTLLDLTETWIYTGSYALVAADVLAGQVTNQATVLGTLPSAIVVTDLSDDNSVLENDATVTRLCPIAIIKEGTLNVLNGNCAVVGDTIDYTFTVTNEGNEILSAINVTDPLVPIITFLSGDTNGDTLLDLTETWIYTGSYALVAADVLAGQVTNQATVLGTLPSAIVVTDLSDDNSVLENDATVTRLCPIAIIKEGTLNVLNGNCAVVGDTIDYTFTVTNEGNEILSAINVTDPLVPIITFLSGDTNGDTLLDLTETWIYTGSYALVAADVLAGQVTNQATVLGTLPSAIVVTDLSDDNSVLENDATVTRLCPIAIIKEGTLNVLNGNCAVVGDTIDYTFTVTNEGNEILSAINVTDPLVPIITFLSGDTNGDTLLDLTETWIYTGSYALVAADVLAGQVTNQATVLGTLPSAIVVTDLSDDNSVLENDATVTRLCPIAIIKEGTLNVLNGNCAVVGDTIDYTFTVTNEGNEILSAINVTDPLVPIITFLSGDTNGDTLLDLTETWIYTGSYALVAADVLAGQVTNQATVLGTLPSAIVVTDLSDDNSVLENDATVTRLCPIAIIKEGTLNVLNGNCAVVGDTIDYTFTVTNEGNEILSAINVTDPLVPIITFLSGDTNGDTLLDLTETWIYTGSYALVAADVLAGQVTNQATVLGTLPSAIVVTDLSDDNSVLENDATVTRLCPIAIIKEGTLNVLNGNCAVVGDTIDYTFTVTNEGNEILSAINVTDPLVPIITFLSGDTNGDTLLDLTETWIYTGSYALVAADVLAGQVTNQATVLGTLPSAIVVTDLSDDNSVLENDATVTRLCPIAIIKEGTLNVLNGNCAVVGDTIDYTFTVTNEGNEILSAINVTDPLVPIITFLSGDTNGDTLLDLTETWIYTGSYALVAADVLAGQVTNQATVLGTLPSAIVVTDLSDDNSVLENDATVTRLCPIAIIKEGTLNVLNGDCAVVGDTIDYTFTVTNEGNEILSAINVTDPLVPIITFLSGDTNGDTLLDLTETWIYTGSYALVAADVLAGQVTNQATVLGTLPSAIVVTDLSDDNSVLENDATVTRLCPIAIIKEGTLNVLNGNCAVVGDTIDYTFTVTNEGNEILSAINVTDPLVPIITFLSGDTNGDTLLDLTETWIYTGSYALVAADVLAGQVTNQATVLGTLPSAIVVTDLSDDNSVLENDATVTRLCPIAIIKEGTLNVLNGNCAVVGDTIDYTFTVTNEGNEILSAINVTDPLVPIITFLSGDTNGDTLLDLTETWIYTGSYALVAADVLAGQVTNQATVLGTLPSAIVVTDLSDDNSVLENDATVTRLCPIAIIKEGTLNVLNGNCAVVGDTIDYTFTVTNEGNEILSAINVTDPLVPIITFLSGDTNGDTLLDLTETWIYTGSYALVAADVLAGQVTNQATVLGTLPSAIVVTDLSDDNSVLENDATVTRLCPIAIIKEGTLNVLNGNCAVVGDTIDYTFTVTNEGNEILSAINVTDPLVPIITFLSGDTNGDTFLDLTETWIYTGSYALVAADVLAGQVTNQATVLGTLPSAIVVTDLSDDNSVLENDATVTVLCQEEAIAIIKTGVFNEVNGNDCADAEIDTVTYTFTVTNEGGSAITSVTVTDPLLGGLLTAIPTGDTDGDNELDVTETWVYVQGYTITQSDIDTGSISNQATADGTGSTGPVSDLSDDNLTTEDDVTVTVLCQNDSIALIKTGVFNDSNGDSCADVDETITYSFTVINNGNTTIGNIAITDALVNVQGGPITLAPGATDNTTFTATYLITQANIDNGNVTNTATASGFNPLGVVVSDISDDSSELEDDVTITVLCQNDSIALIKTGVFNDSNGDSCADVDETITYSFTVINNGNTTIGNIAITDALVNVQGGPITLAPGQTDTTTFTATYLIIQPDINTGSVTNTATASGFNPLGVVVSDISDVASELEDAPTVTLLCNNAVIALIKTGIPTDENGDGCIDLGETIVYDFVVTNLGNVTLTNVIVTDPMITVNGGSITLFAGDSDTETFSGSYTIVQSDIDAGQVSNQAIAEGLDPLGVVVNDLSDNNSNLEDDATISLLCQDPIIALEKTGIFNDENSNLISEVGETISYTFVVTNRGNVTLFNIAIVDPFPRVVIEGGPIFQLLPGEIDDTTFTATYTITAQDVENGEVLNQAIVSATTFDGDEVTDLSDDPTDFTDADSDGDGDPDDITVVILPNVDAPFDVFNAVSPDGNNQNDFFLIQGISEFPDNTVEIYNRWGVLVWEASGYGGSNDAENVFVGESNGRATVSQDKLLITGTYYYVIKFNGNNPGQDSYAGYLYLNR